MLTIKDETRLAESDLQCYTLTQRMDDLTGLLLWGGSRLTCIVKTSSPCLSSHDEDRNTFQFQLATSFTATLLFQPQLITTLYIQLQMIKHIHRHFVILHTCMQTLFHTEHSREVQEIFRCAHNNKTHYFIETFLIRGVHCKRNTFLRLFLSARFITFNHRCCRFFLSGSGSRYTIKFLIWGCIMSILAPNITTGWYFNLV